MLLDDIIAALSDENASLTGALLKTKVLLFQLDRQDLVQWVDKELKGYPDENDVPDYRVVPSHVRANLMNPGWRVDDHPIPIGHLKPEHRDSLERSRVALSLAAIEELTRKGGQVMRPIPMEMNAYLGKKLGNAFQVQRAWCEISVHDLKTILVNVRSRLLDFMLELKTRAGDVQGVPELKEKADTMDTTGMFANAVLSGNTIIVGSGNVQNVRHQVVAGDLESLVRALTQAGIPNDEIAALRAAVGHDQAKLGHAALDGETGSWFTLLLGKAAKKTLDVGVDVVSQVISKALTSYIGGG